MKSDTPGQSFPFFDSPFSSKGKRRKRGWRIEADDWHTRPVFSSFTANSLNRIMRIWVRLKRHHRRNRAKTILFFHSYDRNGRSSERRTSSLLECYPESRLLTTVKSRHWTRRETYSCKVKAKTSLQLYPVVFTCHVLFTAAKALPPFFGI